MKDYSKMIAELETTPFDFNKKGIAIILNDRGKILGREKGFTPFSKVRVTIESRGWAKKYMVYIRDSRNTPRLLYYGQICFLVNIEDTIEIPAPPLNN
jgi:hypothetical protein